MRLTVREASENDVCNDIVRVPEKYRIDKNNKPIENGAICKITVNSKSVYAIMRGHDNNDSLIRIDYFLRRKLELEKMKEYDFNFTKTNVFSLVWWALNSSDPAYKIASWLGVLSVSLGVLSLFLSLSAFLTK